MTTTRTRTDHHLGPVGQIPLGEGREFLVGGHRVAVFRLRDGRLAATDAACPHRGGPLADGIAGMGSVICPLHGMRFALVDGASPDGACSVAIHPVRTDHADGMILTLPGAAA